MARLYSTVTLSQSAVDRWNKFNKRYPITTSTKLSLSHPDGEGKEGLYCAVLNRDASYWVRKSDTREV